MWSDVVYLSIQCHMYSTLIQITIYSGLGHPQYRADCLGALRALPLPEVSSFLAMNLLEQTLPLTDYGFPA